MRDAVIGEWYRWIICPHCRHDQPFELVPGFDPARPTDTSASDPGARPSWIPCDRCTELFLAQPGLGLIQQVVGMAPAAPRSRKPS